ncbi:winged helix-turn-helix domain-containing protein [Haloarchaeobius baliensis]|uniref:winged helix-turn-helix domain-containing protein n=1 Tax=Haloarchaeobius baliensis TaxID=1670458 RepID=UPI003F883461
MGADRQSETSEAVEERAPDDVFGLLGSEARVDILRALGSRPDDEFSFSELFDAVAIDDSGNFNYHLEKLRGVFVRKTDGYGLTHAGKSVVGAMYAGTYTANAAIEPISADWDCLLCGGEMLIHYEDERVRFRCEDCEEGASFPFPPGNLDEFDRDELPRAFARWYHQSFRKLFNGFCGVCSGRVERELLHPPESIEEGRGPSEVAFECTRCGSFGVITGGSLVTMHPIVEGFLAEHGFDVSARHPSQIWAELDDHEAFYDGHEQPAFGVRFAVDDEQVVATVTADGFVEDVRREPRAD